MNGLYRRELVLLLLTGLILINGLIAAMLAVGKIQFSIIIASICFMLFLLGVHAIISTKKHKGDLLLLPLGSLSTAIGLIMIFRLKPGLFYYQLAWVFIGLLLFALTALFADRIYALADYKYIWGLIGIVLLLSAIIFGVEIGGNKNWIVIGPVHFQPSEFAKLFIILFLASYYEEKHELLAFATKNFGPFVLPHPRFIAPLIIVWGITLLMLIFQRDFGATLLYFGTTIVMTYIASGRLSYVIGSGLVFLLGVAIVYTFYPHVQTRFDIWLNPWSDPTGKAYQVIQSLFALGSGGILGSGLNYGFPDLIPEVHTDFIFAAIGEEMGLAGAAAVIFIYIVIVYRSFKIAIFAETLFCSFFASGLAVFFALQIFVIIGGVTKFLPLTGVTLPFISYGGSSTVANYLSLGILVALSETGSVNAK